MVIKLKKLLTKFLKPIRGKPEVLDNIVEPIEPLAIMGDEEKRLFQTMVLGGTPEIYNEKNRKMIPKLVLYNGVLSFAMMTGIVNKKMPMYIVCALVHPTCVLTTPIEIKNVLITDTIFETVRKTRTHLLSILKRMCMFDIMMKETMSRNNGTLLADSEITNEVFLEMVKEECPIEIGGTIYKLNMKG